MSGEAIINEVSSSAWGVEHHGGAQLRIYGTKFDSCNGTASGGIWLKCEAADITGCQFEGMGIGIKVDGISGNTVDGKFNRIFGCYFQNLNAGTKGAR
jgi:hypothetical protein